MDRAKNSDPIAQFLIAWIPETRISPRCSRNTTSSEGCQCKHNLSSDAGAWTLPLSDFNPASSAPHPPARLSGPQLYQTRSAGSLPFPSLHLGGVRPGFWNVPRSILFRSSRYARARCCCSPRRRWRDRRHHLGWQDRRARSFSSHPACGSRIDRLTFLFFWCENALAVIWWLVGEVTYTLCLLVITLDWSQLGGRTYKLVTIKEQSFSKLTFFIMRGHLRSVYRLAHAAWRLRMYIPTVYPEQTTVRSYRASRPWDP